ncbi:Uncharacterized conserved protein [Escherichia coli]|nr:Uncharacterized conserved protein [Escherichia coli]
MIKKPVIGISGCLGGSAVRFDGGHKRDDFLMDKLVEWVTFRPVCPEMAIGLPVSASCSTTCALEARKYTDVFQPRPE